MYSPEILEKVTGRFGMDTTGMHAEPLQQGLINTTWRVHTGGGVYILQRINEEVFQDPRAVTHNIDLIAAYLQKEQPGYVFAGPVKTPSGASMLFEPGAGYFRMFPFVRQSHTKNTVSSAEEAFEAARQFGRFTAALKGFDHTSLHTTIPGFHDLAYRYHQFTTALADGNAERRRESRDVIEALDLHTGILSVFGNIRKDPAFRLRVTHHDTKISNVLFDQANKGICVIDLDTVMPGYFISDVGDMMRTYLCPVSEEEADLDKVMVRPAYFEAIVDGYMTEMGDELSAAERRHFLFAGHFLVYMQALRFLTDYLNNDTYYQVVYPGQNLVRAKNQVRLLNCMQRLVPPADRRIYVTAG